MTVYATIEHLLPGIGGWCSLKKAQHLAALVHSTHSTVSVEIGVHAGKSALPMGIMHKAMGHGKLYAIDAWEPKPSILGQNAADQAYWGNPENHRLAKDQFVRWITGLGLINHIEIVQADSNTCPVPDGISVLHVDGNHGTQTTTDVKRFAPNVVTGGFCVMDDLQWSNNGPAEAVVVLESYGFKELVRLSRNFEANTDQKDDYGVWQKK